MGPTEQEPKLPIWATSQVGKNTADFLAARLPTFGPQFLCGSNGKILARFRSLVMVLHFADGETGPEWFITNWQARKLLGEGRLCHSVPDLALEMRTALTAQQHLALPGHQAVF